MPLSDKDLQHDKKRRNSNNNNIASGNNPKKSRREGSSRNNENDQSAAVSPTLPTDLWENILCFLDVPDLGSCALVSKEISAIVMNNDAVWEQHVRKLLRMVFDGAFHIDTDINSFREGHLPTPISERPLKSTNFYHWYMEWVEPTLRVGSGYNKIADMYRKAVVRDYYKTSNGKNIDFLVYMAMVYDGDHKESVYSWLFEDVPLRTYYMAAGRFAYYNYMRYLEERREEREVVTEEDSSYCDTDDDEDECEEEFGYRNGDSFRGLPNIRLFHGLGGLPTICACTVTLHADQSKSRSLYRSYYLDSEGNVGYRYIDAAGREVNEDEWYRREEWD